MFVSDNHFSNIKSTTTSSAFQYKLLIESEEYLLKEMSIMWQIYILKGARLHLQTHLYANEKKKEPRKDNEINIWIKTTTANVEINYANKWHATCLTLSTIKSFTLTQTWNSWYYHHHCKQHKHLQMQQHFECLSFISAYKMENFLQNFIFLMCILNRYNQTISRLPFQSYPGQLW